MARAGRGGMNAIVFQLKRAHRASVRACRWLVEVLPGMTPARFDVLLLLRRAGIDLGTRRARKDGLLRRTDANGCFTGQADVIKALGLHRSTVSEALGTLEEMGWIHRWRDYDDRRFQLVGLTDLGLAQLHRACKLLWRMKLLKEPVDWLVRWLEPELPFNEAFEKVWATIDSIACYFGDSSTRDLYDRQEGDSMAPVTDPAGYIRDAIVRARMTVRPPGAGADSVVSGGQSEVARRRECERWRR